MEIVVGIVLAVVWFLIFHWWRTNLTSPIRNWPVIGSLPALLHNAKRIHEYLTQILKQSGHTIVVKGVWLTNNDYILTSDPVNVNHILNRNFSNYSDRPHLKTIMEPFGDGIFTADQHLWRFERKIIHSVMKQSKFQSTLEKVIFGKVKKGLVPVLDHVSQSGSIVDLQEIFGLFNYDSSSKLILGYDPNCLSVEFLTSGCEITYDHIAEGIIRRHVLPDVIWKLQRWAQIGEEKRFYDAWKAFDRVLYDRISLTRQKLKTKIEEEEEFDVLTALLVNEEEQSDKFIRDMAFNLLGAGRDTITSPLTWFFWLISNHPRVENKIIQEIRANLVNSNFFSTSQEVNKLVYLHAALCETMRLYPPIALNHKSASKADVLPSGHRVDPDANIILSFYSMGRMEEIWGPDCLEFKPERWVSDKGEIIHVPSYKFSAFSAGPKSCLGKNMAFIEMKMIASAVVWNYRLLVMERQQILPNPSLALLLRHGLKVKVLKRQV